MGQEGQAPSVRDKEVRYEGKGGQVSGSGRLCLRGKEIRYEGQGGQV